MRGDWLGKFRREQRMLARVRRAAWRLEQAEKERDWALASARAGGASVRKVAEAAGLSPTRVHQLTKDASAQMLEAMLAELRAVGWPAPEDPDGSGDEELSGRADVAGRLVDEVGWLRQCAEWIDHLERESYPPVVNLRPEADFPDRHPVMVDLPRVAAVLRRIANDIDELARARSIEDLDRARTRDDPRAGRRRRLAEPDLASRSACGWTEPALGNIGTAVGAENDHGVGPVLVFATADGHVRPDGPHAPANVRYEIPAHSAACPRDAWLPHGWPQ